MTSIVRLAAVLLALPLAAGAETVAPEAVTYEDGAVNVSLTGTPGDAKAGREVMSTRSLGNCVACHVVSEMPEVPFQGNVGPTLDGVGDRWTEGELRGIVIDAKHMYEGTIMPSFYKTSGYIRPGEAFTTKPAQEPLPPLLTAQQVEDVVAYLMTLKE